MGGWCSCTKTNSEEPDLRSQPLKRKHSYSSSMGSRDGSYISEHEISVSYDGDSDSAVEDPRAPVRKSKSKSKIGSSAPRQRPRFLSDYPSMFEDCARFFRGLPERSRKQVWDHSVAQKDRKGKKRKQEATSSRRQKVRLMASIVILFMKYLYKKDKAMSTEDVLPWVDHCSKWLHEQHPEIHRRDFLHRTRFSDWLAEYSSLYKHTFA